MPRYDGEDDDRRREDEADDRPRRRRRREDDDYEDGDRPRGKSSGGGSNVALILVVVAIVLLILCGGGGALLFYSVSKVRTAASKVNEMNNLKQIGMGFHNYADRNRRLPPAEGDLSWRVHMLPYIEQDSLARSFDMNLSWDAGRNAGVANTVVPTYHSPLDEAADPKTHYRVFVGPNTVYDPAIAAFGLTRITDGAGNTILAVDTTESVSWPQPNEIPFTKNGSLPSLGHTGRDQGIILFCDGSVKPFNKSSMSQDTLKAMVTANGNETIPDW